GFSLSGGGVG
uniref:Sperm-activating peptide (Ser-3,5 SAP-I) n=3 Tax=Echinacea TaxID=7674 RepID=Q7M4C4_ECHMA|nr:sperm-activating peptide I (3,5-Ser) [Mesocentrotus nudus]